MPTSPKHAAPSTSSPLALVERAEHPEFVPPAPLGIGLLVNQELLPLVEAAPDLVDYIEFIPDLLWEDRGLGAKPRFSEPPVAAAFAQRLSQLKPLVAHGVGLSIGSAHGFDTALLGQVAMWADRLGYRWHSDHVSFTRAHVEDGGSPAALMGNLPLAYDFETLDMIAARVAEVRRLIPRPFLLENNVDYIRFEDGDLPEPEFLSRLSARTGCGILLDLHNLYTNSRNHSFDAWDFLAQLDLSRVVEIHLAGGLEFGDLYIDAHSGPCPDPVWEMLAHVLSNAPNLAGVTFEIESSHVERTGFIEIAAQLDLARAAWLTNRPAPEFARCR